MGDPSAGNVSESAAARRDVVSFGEALRVWVKVAAYSFGGPAGQIAVMHRLLVEEKRWLSEERFLHALNYCMLLPGPEAQQLATYSGWLLHRVKGGLVAGCLFIVPGFVSILGLSVLYAGFQHTSLVQGLFYGLKPAVLALVFGAILRISSRALRGSLMVAIAVLAFVAMFFFDVPFPFVVVSAAALGLMAGRRVDPPGGEEDAPGSELAGSTLATARPPLASTLRTAALWLSLWLVPVALMTALLGTSSVFVQEGWFFSKASVLTFGGAYAVLAYVAQQAVNQFGWLQPGEMLDGLGMAETTPGPLIQVVQFVGFMGAYRQPGSLDPMLAGVLGSLVTTWVTFAPCFLWIFVGAPYIEYLRGSRALSRALKAVTASVVGVIANLAAWFALHTLFAQVDEIRRSGLRLLVPSWSTLDIGALGLAGLAAALLFGLRWGIMRTLSVCVLAGWAWHTWMIV